MPRHNANTPKTFWSRVDRSGECWMWTGAVGAHGYGRLQYQGRQMTAHRLAYELAIGKPPTGRLVCHICDNRLCCRSGHLWLGTIADNIGDAVTKGRMHLGEAHGNARLTAADVARIREQHAAGTRGVDIARQFGVHPNTVYNIAKRRIWAWL